MPSKRDHYDVLGVHRSAGDAEIKSAYRKLARELHPDRNKAPDAAVKFAEVQEAYDALSDTEKRRIYDQFGHNPPGSSGFGSGNGAGAGGVRYSWSGGSPFGDSDVGDIFESIFGGAAAGGGPFGGGRAAPTGHARAKPGKARDTEAVIEVDFMTAALGGSRTVRVGDATPREIDVKIPRGQPEGGRLRVRGGGMPGPRGGPPGDLLLTVHIAKHPYFRREGLNVELDLPLNIAEASLGAKLNVPTLTGSVELSIPPGASSGQRLRLKGLGIKDESGSVGDLFAVVKLVAPKSLDPADRSALEELGTRLENPRGAHFHA